MTPPCHVTPRRVFEHRIVIDTDGLISFTVLPRVIDDSFRTIFYAFFSQASHVSGKHVSQQLADISTSILRLCASPPEATSSTAGRSTAIYLFLPPTVAFENALTSYFFASDPQGSKRVSEPELETYCITVEHTVGESECGFNPHSAQAAEYLGLPLFQLHGIDSEKVKDMCCDIEENIREVAQLSSGLTARNVMIVMMTVVILFSVQTFMSGVV
ncbi:uncharacterized protein ARMOST_11308 [Armillaria ostoyae]|uniref:Uncharacterized protein n=1 Tax=Armillaria ostoyae TaxID=47428 RepID=A0A284RGS4_ARMOS|nr:uncharacterized protein ARMOST_11308 [Armillaria ostoyae]